MRSPVRPHPRPLSGPRQTTARGGEGSTANVTSLRAKTVADTRTSPWRLSPRTAGSPVRPIRANFGGFGALEGLAEVARGRLRATETSPRVPFANGTPAPGGVVLADQSRSTRKRRRVSLGWPLQRRLNDPPDAYVSAYAPPPHHQCTVIIFAFPAPQIAVLAIHLACPSAKAMFSPPL